VLQKTVRCCVSANVLFVEKGQYVLLSHRRRYRSRFGLIFNTVQDAASFVKALCLVCPKKRNTPTNNSLRDVKPDSLSNYVLLSVESQRIRTFIKHFVPIITILFKFCELFFLLCYFNFILMQ
jgi:hypothetical protein